MSTYKISLQKTNVPLLVVSYFVYPFKISFENKKDINTF